MIAITALSMLAAVVASCFVLIYRDRVQALAHVAIENDSLRDALAEFRYQLDDAKQEIHRLQVANGYHIREGFVANAEADRLRIHNRFLKACHQHRRDVAAGILLVGDVGALHVVDVP